MPQSFAEELSSIPMSPGLGQSLERAHRFAREQSHRAVTLEHLLLALTEDAEAAVILQSANIDLARLSTDVSGYLGRLLEDMRAEGGAEPRPDAELLRVMQAAASAATQSRRKQIDGAIVLAAIVGDGKSPAAGMLKALGMTFEEAIRALQRANTKARLKPTPKPAAQAAAPPRADAKPAAAEPPAPEPAAATEPASPADPAAPAQTAEEILAAARARILQRSGAAATNKAAPAPSPRKPGSAPAASDGEAQLPPVEPADTRDLTQAIEAAMTTRGVEPAPPPGPLPPAGPPAHSAPAPAAPPMAQAARPAWTPPPEPRPQPAKRIPQPPPPARPQPPFPARPIAPGEGPRRPPLPPPAAAVGQSQPGFPNRPPRAPWPDPAERGARVRPALPNGTLAEPPPAPLERSGARVPAPPRGGGQTEKGLLIESVPRRMRVGVPASAEVRIARDRIESLIVTLNGRGALPLAEQPLTRALSVRLRAPGGDFWIEPAAPETQWVESASSLIHDDYAVWRWTVVARRRGRGRLALMVSARTIGRDGVAADAAPPDRVIEIKVGSNHRQRAARWMGLIMALLAGAAIGRFSDQIWAMASIAIKSALGG